MNRTGFSTALSLLMLGLGLCALPLQAQVSAVPPLMSFSGRLITPAGNPVPDGNYSIRFSLWDNSAAGTEKWNQTISPIAVKNGTFSTLLLVNTAGLFNGNLWLEIKVGADAPLAPRQQLVTAAYAFKAQTVPDGSITNEKIVSVDWSKILNAPASNFTLPYVGVHNDPATIAFTLRAKSNAIAAYGTILNAPTIYAENSTPGSIGYFTGNNFGVYGYSPAGAGVYGVSGGGNGVEGHTRLSNNAGVFGIAETNLAFGVSGVHSATGNYGYLGTRNSGVYGHGLTAGSPGGYFENTAGGLGLLVIGTASVGVLEIRGGADLAEKFAMTGTIEPGMVVEIDPEHEGKLRLASGAFNRRVAGVISGAKNLSAGVVLTDPADKSPNSLPVAMSGRVWVYTDATQHAVEPGDFMTTAERAGHAMPVSEIAKAQGAILGKAMTRLEKGKVGLVLVLVNLQ